MKRRRKILIAAFLLPLLAAGTGAVLWLGPANLAWTARAITASPDSGEPWLFLSPAVPVALSVDVRSLLGSGAGQAARPRLEEVARAAGGRLEHAEQWASRAAWSPGFAVGTGVRAAPGLLAKFGPRWQALGAPHAVAVTDGSGALVPLEPGVVLWSERAEAAQGWTLAAREARTVGGQPELALQPGGPNLRALVRPDDALRRQAARQLPALLSFVAFDLQAAAVDVTAAEKVAFEVRADLASVGSASRLEGLLRQADAAARLARAAGPLAALLGGKDAALLADVPSLDVQRDGARVTVTGALGPEELDRLLVRGLAELNRPR